MQHLYAPWRAKYFNENSDECPFCVAARVNSSANLNANLGENNENLNAKNVDKFSNKNDKKSANSAENLNKKLSENLGKTSEILNENLSNFADKASLNSSPNSSEILSAKDAELGVIFRAKFCFGIMNLYPYSPGHFMVIPYAHEEQIAALPSEAWQEISHFVREGVGILQNALGAKGVNIGMNLGASAGAGIAAHCHYHLVPRWAGDTNFITTIAHTRVCGRDLGEIYEKLRSEFKGVLRQKNE